MSDAPRVVYDCNILLQALMSTRGPSGRCLELAYEGKVLLFCSAFAVAELRRHALDPRLVTRFRITEERVDLLVQNLERVAQFVIDIEEVFQYGRDPSDAHYVNLAMKVQAAWLVTRDKDLLDLIRPTIESDPFRRLCPVLRIVNPVAFLSELALPSDHLGS